MERRELGIRLRVGGIVCAHIHFQPVVRPVEQPRSKINRRHKQTAVHGKVRAKIIGSELRVAQRIRIQLEAEIIEPAERTAAAVQAALIGKRRALSVRGDEMGVEGGEQRPTGCAAQDIFHKQWKPRVCFNPNGIGSSSPRLARLGEGLPWVVADMDLNPEGVVNSVPLTPGSSSLATRG